MEADSVLVHEEHIVQRVHYGGGKKLELSEIFDAH